MLAAAWRQLVELVLPTRCALCQRTGPDVLCESCRALLRPVGETCCARCGRRRETAFASPDCGECHGQPLGVVRSRSLYIYDEAGRELLAAFKFNGYLGAGRLLADDLAEWTAAGWPQLYGEPDVGFDMVVPMPLHPSRLRQRRFNQATLPARTVARRMDLACEPGALARTRRTATQVGLTANQRWENVRGAFAVPEGSRSLLKGRRVLLLDDLMTTGATLCAAARALRRGGAASVHGLTLFSTHRVVEPAAE
jgi:ComF family protein